MPTVVNPAGMVENSPDEGVEVDGVSDLNASIANPSAVVFDARGNMYIASQLPGSITKTDV